MVAGRGKLILRARNSPHSGDRARYRLFHPASRGRRGRIVRADRRGSAYHVVSQHCQVKVVLESCERGRFSQSRMMAAAERRFSQPSRPGHAPAHPPLAHADALSRCGRGAATLQRCDRTGLPRRRRRSCRSRQLRCPPTRWYARSPDPVRGAEARALVPGEPPDSKTAPLPASPSLASVLSSP